MNRLAALIVLLFLSTPFSAHTQTWSTEFGAPPSGNGLNWDGQAMIEYQGRLIVAGGFTQAGPLAVSRIAAWDGTQWSALGGGLPASANALAQYQGDLIAAGGLSLSTGYLRRWNGSAWAAVPSPPGNPSMYLTVCEYNGSLFVESRENGISTLAWWDGESWSSTPLPLAGEHTGAAIYAMTVYNGQLFMTGEGLPNVWPGKATNSGAAPRGFLLSWDGQAFGGPGWIFPADALSLHVYHELLYVGGDWIQPEPPITDGIAIWDGHAWIPFGADFLAFDMETFHGRLVMGGAGLASIDGIAYNGSNLEWMAGGCTFTMWVDAVQEFQGSLYITGGFDEFCTDNGRVSSYHIAKWSEPMTGVGTRPAAPRLRIGSAPNPFNPVVTLTIQVPARSEVDVVISDAAGRVVRRIGSGVQNPGPYRVAWDGAGDGGEKLASGVYFARVTAGRQTATTKLVLLK